MATLTYYKLKNHKIKSVSCVILHNIGGMWMIYCHAKNVLGICKCVKKKKKTNVRKNYVNFLIGLKKRNRKDNTTVNTNMSRMRDISPSD